MSAHKNRKKEYFDGVRAALPVILGFVPVGIAYAVMAHDAGFSAWFCLLNHIVVWWWLFCLVKVNKYCVSILNFYVPISFKLIFSGRERWLER